jgi:hypothetical protein
MVVVMCVDDIERVIDGLLKDAQHQLGEDDKRNAFLKSKASPSRNTQFSRKAFRKSAVRKSYASKRRKS